MQGDRRGYHESDEHDALSNVTEEAQGCNVVEARRGKAGRGNGNGCVIKVGGVR